MTSVRGEGEKEVKGEEEEEGHLNQRPFKSKYRQNKKKNVCACVYTFIDKQLA